MQHRTLTVVFERAVTAAVPSTIEVTVIPLAVTTNPVSNTLLVGGPQTRQVLLADIPTTTTFSLVPSNHVDLYDSIPYRIAWRERHAGHQHTVDFLMPNADVNFADLPFLGSVFGVNGVAVNTGTASTLAAERALRTILTVTTALTLPVGGDYVVFISTGGVVTLPSAVTTSRYSVKNNKTTAAVLATTAGQTIDGQSTLTLVPGEAVELIPNGVNWTIF
jgi:hypothetical protein